MQARNTSGHNPLRPAPAKPQLSTADLFPDYYHKVLPGAQKHTEQYSNHARDLRGATGIRTPDLLHAMNHSSILRPGHMLPDQAIC
jgi:hypothetical protein